MSATRDLINDLAKRLRAFAQGCRGSMWQSRNETITLMDAAADRIEELEAEMGTFRVHTPNARPGQLIAKWGRPGPGEPADICYAWGAHGAEKSDGRILSEALENVPVYEGRSLREELDRRGYDLTTLRFSIEAKSA